MALVDDPMMKTDDAPLVRQGDSLAAEVHALIVADDATFQHAADLSRRLAGWIKVAEEFFSPMKSAAHKTWRAICDREASVIGPKKTLKATLGQRMADYEQAQARLRQQAEAAAQRERDRLEAEARAVAAAEQARLHAEAEECVLQDAIVAEAAGDTQAAARLLNQPVQAPTVLPAPVFLPPVAVSAPQAEGISFSTTWSAELVSLPALVKAAAGGHPGALACVTFDQVRANGLARSLKETMAIPGVKAVPKRGTATRTA